MKTIILANDSEKAWQLLCDAARQLPGEDHELMPGVRWGDCAQLYTPAFWKIQYISHMQRQEPRRIYKLGKTILEEIIVCLLGGFGMPSEVGLAAFDRLKQQQLIRPKVSREQLYQALVTPFVLPNGKKITYRFYNQKSSYIFKLLNRDDLSAIPLHSDLELRSWLLTVNGIGLKTASWITRNWLDSDRVAILDVHILRAGLLAGFYHKNYDLTKYYLPLEKQYLSFCEALDVSSGIMDAIIWDFMKKTNRLALSALKHLG
jgi:thermostable 8-oxoguanine DNA glycosylase